MGKRTKMITYNVNDRGRKETGQDRLLDTVALAAVINSPAMQESVKSGDIQGYFGHWPRMKFGMRTQEGGILDGKAVSLPIAVRAVHLSADEQGNITHQHEFLDTHEGRMASAMYDSNTGGFSSAIDTVRGSSPSIATILHGFDYVLAPNYNGNRGHSVLLDGVEALAEPEVREEVIGVMDAVENEKNAIVALFDSLMMQHKLALEALEHSKNENELLIGKIASGQLAVLDDIIGEEGRVAPMKGMVQHNYRQYLDAPLEAESPMRKARDNSAEAEVARRLGLKDR